MPPTKTLVIGDAYDLETLSFAGWSDAKSHPSWSWMRHFDMTGTYRGPFTDGVEPTFWCRMDE